MFINYNISAVKYLMKYVFVTMSDFAIPTFYRLLLNRYCVIHLFIIILIHFEHKNCIC